MPLLPQAVFCSCESGQPYSDCCAPWHSGLAAPTAVALMRSRYSAYVLGLDDYLLATWHPSTRPEHLERNASTRWLGLRVQSASELSVDTATVLFVARYREGGGRAVRMQERSLFQKEQGRWYYLKALA